MKKALLIGNLVLLGFVSGSSAFAARGACSSHQGVNCSAGPDRDGSVICMDGTRTSSVLYTSMVKCRGTVLSTPVKVVEPKVFIGIPRTKLELARCQVVIDTRHKIYALKGSSAVKAMTLKGKKCVATEAQVKELKYRFVQ